MSRLAARLGATAAGVALYHALDWSWLCAALRAVWGAALTLLGHSVTALDDGSGGFLLLIDPAGAARVVAVTANCTYADLLLTAAPFAWRLRRGPGANALRLVALAAAVAGLNLLRLVFAIQALDAGLPWSLAHDAPDLLVHGAFLAAVLAACLRADFGAVARPRVTMPGAGPPGSPRPAAC